MRERGRTGGGRSAFVLLPIAGAALLVLASLGGCGGATPSSDAADGRGASGGSQSGETAGGEGSGAGGNVAAGPAGPDCSDGTCIVCGSGICPAGFFCDESASGGAACSWLPDCAAAPSCGCVKNVLGSACACEERGGGVFVSCS